MKGQVAYLNHRIRIKPDDYPKTWRYVDVPVTLENAIKHEKTVERTILTNEEEARKHAEWMGKEYVGIYLPLWLKQISLGKNVIVNEAGGWCPEMSSVVIVESKLGKRTLQSEKLGII